VTSTSPPTPTKPMMVVRLKKAHRHHRVIIIVVKIAFYLIENTHTIFYTSNPLFFSRETAAENLLVSLSLSLCVCVCARARVVGESRGNVYRHRFKGFRRKSRLIKRLLLLLLLFFFFFFTKTLNKKP
jgi:hypothetical protein